MKCAFAGPKLKDLPFKSDEQNQLCDSLKQRLVKEITELCEQGVMDYYGGMAAGVELWCSEIVVALREAYPGISLHAIRPSADDLDGMTPEYQIRYENVLHEARPPIVLHEQEMQGCYLSRRRCMIDQCDILLAVCDRKNIRLRIGVGAAVRYARRLGKRIIFVPPAI